MSERFARPPRALRRRWRGGCKAASYQIVAVSQEQRAATHTGALLDLERGAGRHVVAETSVLVELVTLVGRELGRPRSPQRLGVVLDHLLHAG